MTIRLAVPNKGRLQQPTAAMLKQGGFSYEKTDRALAVPGSASLQCVCG